MATSTQRVSPLLQSFWFWAGIITLARIIVLVTADGDLGPDEAQYWVWAQNPDFGYFSKPPMIAWIIGLTTSLFGDAQWAIRVSAPFIHLGTASFLYVTTRSLFDKKIALFTGLGWLTLPGIAVSSLLITTDAPLLFFWSGALFFMFRILQKNHTSLTDFIALGAMIGLGLMSKYAMIYFPVALAALLILSPTSRKKFQTRYSLATIVLAVAIIAPNLLWNAAHDFQTVSHTAANANWGATLFKPARLGGFLIAQFAVFGPILFASLIAAFVVKTGPLRRAINHQWLALAIFSATPLLIVSGQAFISRAHANWAAASYPAALILATAFLCTINQKRLVKASLTLHAVIAMIIAICVTNFALLDKLGAGRAVSELRGWRMMTDQIAEAATARDYDSILFDDRSMIGEMLYYQRDKDFEVAALDPNAGVDHFYEASIPFDPVRHQRALFVSILPSDAHVDYRFERIEKVGVVTGALGPQSPREFTLFDISGYYEPGTR